MTTTIKDEIHSLEGRMQSARLRAKAAIFLREATQEQIDHILAMYSLLTGSESYEDVVFSACAEIIECKLRLNELMEPVCD